MMRNGTAARFMELWFLYVVRFVDDCILAQDTSKSR